MDFSDTTDNKSTKRVLVVVGVGLAVLAVIAVLGFALYSARMRTTNKLTLTNYTDAGVKYRLLFYQNSSQKNANSILSITQGGKRPVADSTQVIVSPNLGKYGTRVAIFMVPIPANRAPLVTNNDCNTVDGLVKVFSVTMKEDGSTAIVCGSKMTGSLQVEYVFQFSQHNQTYNGFVLLPFDWDQVTKNPTDAKAFLSYASLKPYNRDLQQIISSITTQ